ncbi:MAG: SpoIID/LytB domain-containing protein [Candidatus Dormibacteraeota bacterium]|nr:SpoIID/LytB domain-containing protein [Candidatus Dormibacteraeota bacterium]
MALLLLVTAVPAHADDPSTLADRLAQVQQEQARQHQRLSALEGQQNQLRQTLAGLEAQLAQSSADLAPIAAKAHAIETQIADAQLQLSHDQLAYRQHIRAFQADMRKLYALGGMRWLEFVFSARSFDDLLNRTIYLQHISVSELQLARKLRAERDTLDAQRRVLAQARADLAPLLDALQARANAIASQVAAVASYDSELDSLRRQTVIRLAGLQGQSRALQSALDRYETEAAQAALRGSGVTYGATCPPAAPPGSVRFCGHGWGHGVGLGQWGAKGMALAGLNYRFIDQHFYSGTTWASLDTANTPIHVAVLWGTATYRVITNGPAQLVAGGRVTNLAPGQSVSLAASGGVQKVVPTSAGTRLTVYGPSGRYHAYRGTIVAQPSGGILYIINVLPIEDYLRGLGEVPSSWPLEAIKAQIVAARCYALTHMGSTGLYDVDDTTQFQVYRGIDSESGSQNAAVDQTTGQVLMYGGRVIEAFFSASDGGHTANVSDVFGGSLATYPYLRGVVDPWDVVAPRHTWYTGLYTYTALERVFFSGGDVATYGHLKGFDLRDRDASNRLNTVVLIGSRGVKRIGVSAFLRAFNRSPLTGTDVLWNEMFGTTPAQTWPYWH